MKNLEQELKICLDEREYLLLKSHANGQTAEQTNYYFVCEQPAPNSLLRIRHCSQAYILCFKEQLSSNNGVTVSTENSAEITQALCNTFLKNGISPKHLADMLSVKSDKPYQFCGQLATQRTNFNLDGFSIELDKNFFLDTVDFELECEHDDIAEFERLKGILLHKFAIDSKAQKPKSQRFFERLADVQQAKRLAEIRNIE